MIAIKKQGFFHKLCMNKDMNLMILPGIIFFFIFCYIPIYGIIIAFKDYDLMKGIMGSEWVGLKNILLFFKDPYFFRLIRNSLLLNVYSLIFAFPASIIFALLLNEVRHIRYKKFVQSISYLPYFISVVVVVGIMMQLFSYDGIINSLTNALGMKSINFFSQPEWFRPLYVGSKIWQEVGYSSIIYLATMAGISEELYEAAIIDGANRWQRVWNITVPAIRPTITIMLLFSIGIMLNSNFQKIFVMYNPGTYETADVIDTYVYRRGIQGMDYSYSAAVSLFNSFVSMILLIFANKMSKKFSETSLW